MKTTVIIHVRTYLQYGISSMLLMGVSGSERDECIHCEITLHFGMRQLDSTCACNYVRHGHVHDMYSCITPRVHTYLP